MVCVSCCFVSLRWELQTGVLGLVVLETQQEHAGAAEAATSGAAVSAALVTLGSRGQCSMEGAPPQIIGG